MVVRLKCLKRYIGRLNGIWDIFDVSTMARISRGTRSWGSRMETRVVDSECGDLDLLKKLHSTPLHELYMVVVGFKSWAYTVTMRLSGA